MSSERGRALLLLLLVWLAFFFPVVLGKVRFPVDYAGPATAGERAQPVSNDELGDAYYAMYPWHDYLGERLRHGEVPLWDPHRFAGTPFAADIGVGTWYPPNWAYAAADRLLVFTLLAMATSLAALLVTYWFLRVHQLRPAAAALGAVAFGFSAFLVKWGTNETVVASTIWMALPLGGLEVARQGRRWRGIGLAGLGLLLPILGGHAQIALYVWFVTAIWVVVRVVVAAVAGRAAAGPGLLRRVLDAAWPAAAAAAVAVGVGAIQIVPALELSAHALRQDTPFELARLSFLPTRHLPTLVVPEYLGTPVDGNYAGPGVNYTDTALYAGLVTVPLALVGLLHRRRALAVFLGAVGAVGILGATGTPPALYRFLLGLPGFSHTLSAARLSLLFNFAAAGLAALGLDRLLDRERSRRTGVILAGAHLALTVVVGWLAVARPWTTLPGGYILERGLRSLAVVVVGGLLLAAIVARPSWASRLALAVVALLGADLWMSGFRYNTFHESRAVYRSTPAVQALQEASRARTRYADVGPALRLPPNDALVHGQYGLGGYDPLIPRRLVELVSVEEDFRQRAKSNFFGPFEVRTARTPVFDLLGVGRLVGDPALATAIPGPPEVLGPTTVFDRTGAFPAAFLAPCWEQVSDRQALARIRTMTSSELRSVALVAAGATARRALGADGHGACTASAAGQATLARYEEEEILVRTVSDRRSVLVLTDTWFPGWEATVDGRRAPVLRVDHALRGVVVPAGEHQVSFRYRPQSLRIGAAVTALSLLGAVVAGLVSIVTGPGLGRRLRWRRARLARARSAAPGPPRDRPPGG